MRLQMEGSSHASFLEPCESFWNKSPHICNWGRGGCDPPNPPALLSRASLKPNPIACLNRAACFKSYESFSKPIMRALCLQMAGLSRASLLQSIFVFWRPIMRALRLHTGGSPPPPPPEPPPSSAPRGGAATPPPPQPPSSLPRLSLFFETHHASIVFANVAPPPLLMKLEVFLL